MAQFRAQVTQATAVNHLVKLPSLDPQVNPKAGNLSLASRSEEGWWFALSLGILELPSDENFIAHAISYIA
jgi:hypothetical protein